MSLVNPSSSDMMIIMLLQININFKIREFIIYILDLKQYILCIDNKC